MIKSHAYRLVFVSEILSSVNQFSPLKLSTFCKIKFDV